ncbi:MAG: biotin--[acetyl-CoA-carboxylase] ligase [Gemmatimonadetes bacterium]|nr:MAG: biotin--[acetyl-CoA-carboxylase] ligase [Gemmatimonadota bacterium]
MALMDPEVHVRATTTSTNDDIHRLAEAGAPDGTVVMADAMTAGRGSRGRTWHAELGGVWISVLRRPAASIETAVLSLRVGLGLAAVLQQLVGHPVALKWPNDLVVGQRKVGGILCEMRWHGARPAWVAIGVGVNVANRLPDAMRHTATTLAEVVPGLSLVAVRDAVIPVLRTVKVDDTVLDPLEIAAFDRRNWLRGRALRAPVKGTIGGIDQSGGLEVTGTDGTSHVLRAGDLILSGTA